MKIHICSQHITHISIFHCASAYRDKPNVFHLSDSGVLKSLPMYLFTCKYAGFISGDFLMKKNVLLHVTSLHLDYLRKCQRRLRFIEIDVLFKRIGYIIQIKNIYYIISPFDTIIHGLSF